MNVSYEGIGYLGVTLPAGSCVAGSVCMINAQGKADFCDEGDDFCGYVEAVEGGLAAVQMGGFVKLPYSGTKPICGRILLAGDGKGGVAADDSGRDWLVVEVDEKDSTITVKL